MLYERPLQTLGAAAALYQKAGIRPPDNPDFTVGLYDRERLVAAGSRRGDLLLGLAVDPADQGEGVSAQLITCLLREASERGLADLCLFTRPEKAGYFQSLGFRLVASAPPYAALLEWGRHGLRQYLDFLQASRFEDGGDACAVVMNANPFTLGHRYLVERAAAENRRVYLFAVQEDVSDFPFPTRLALLREGTADLKNVQVLPGGRYIVSALTFPSYFTRDGEAAQAHAALDAALFAQRIAPALHITRRYAGTEPHSAVTACYNQEMRERLPAHGIAFVELPRRELGGNPISATTVRRLLEAGRREEALQYLPPCTRAFLEHAGPGELPERFRRQPAAESGGTHED